MKLNKKETKKKGNNDDRVERRAQYRHQSYI